MIVLLVAIALVAAACSTQSEPATTTSTTSDILTSAPAPATTAGSLPVTTLQDLPVEDAAILREANTLLVVPTEEQVAIVAAAMAATGDDGWVPFLVDLLRTFGFGDSLRQLETALETLTGVPISAGPGGAYRTYGAWMYREEPMPVAGYIGWKARLFGLIDPAFGPLIESVDDPVLASQLQWGGVRRGGIPELNDAPTITVVEADYMTPGELTFGAVINDEIRSYPHRILDHHELANDTLGGEPVALANCTLCRTGVLFSRIVDGRVLDFQTSGLLRNSNKVMVDVQTDSLWNQLTGEAIAGPLEGTVLERFPVTVTTYGEWIAEHPTSDVVAVPGLGVELPQGVIGAPYSYEPGDAYADYYASDDLWFPVAEVPDVFSAKALVATVDLDGEQLAVGIEELAAAGPQLLEIAGTAIVVVETSGGARVYDTAGSAVAVSDVDPAAAGEESLVLSDGTELPRVQSGHSFWFAWYVNFPDTETWPTG